MIFFHYGTRVYMIFKYNLYLLPFLSMRVCLVNIHVSGVFGIGELTFHFLVGSANS